MPYEFRLDLSTAAGEKVAEVTDFKELACSVGVNQAGMLAVTFPSGHQGATLLEERSQMDLFYRDINVGLDWTLFFGGIYLSQSRNYMPREFMAAAAGYPWMLGTRINAYPANMLNRTKFISTPVETIMKSMVRYNVTAEATTANGRLRAGTNWPATVITVETDGALGTVRDWYCAQVPLLEDLGSLAKIAGGDFDVIKVLGGFEFRFYPGQRGVDRSGQVVFSLAQGNMGSATYSRNRVAEATVAIIGGQGEEALRDFAVRTSADFSAADDMEIFVPATQVEPGNFDGLNAAGDKKLFDVRAPAVFKFTIIQTPSSRYGFHYSLGDLVPAVNPDTGILIMQKVMGATVSLRTGSHPDISVKAETV